MLPDYTQQGYAYEASKCILDAAFHHFELKKVNAITTPTNTASQKLLRKLGLTLMGTVQLPNSKDELLLFSVEA